MRRASGCLGQTVAAYDHIYTIGDMIQGRNDAGLTTHCLSLDVQKAHDTFVEEWVCVWRKELVRQQRDQRIGVENDEANDGMCSKYCGVGRAITLLCYKELHKDVPHLSPSGFKAYISGIIVAVEAATQGVTVGGWYGVGMELCGCFRAVIRNT